MISRNSGGGFFAAHWDWIVAAAGVVALVGGVVLFTMSGNGDPEENAANVVRRLKSAKRTDTGVKPVDMSTYERALQFAVKPLQIAEVEETGGNFLVSERRVFCKSCKKPIKDGSKTCPFCGEASTPTATDCPTGGRRSMASTRRRTTRTRTRTATALPMPRSSRPVPTRRTRALTRTTSIRSSSCCRLRRRCFRSTSART